MLGCSLPYAQAPRAQNTRAPHTLTGLCSSASHTPAYAQAPCCHPCAAACTHAHARRKSISPRQLALARRAPAALPLSGLCPHAVSGVLRVVMLSIAEVVGKPPTESVFFEKYGRISVVIDEVVNEVKRAVLCVCV